ncbi:MAG: NADH-ubiquinone oxidoreductase-F iron-sulfur binding region domain-containing protein [Syntrophobacteria bacterium]
MCTPTADRTCACEEVRQALEAEISVQGLKLSVGAMKTACDGVCRYGPLVGFPQRGFFYRQVSPERAREVVAETLAKGHILFDLLHCDPLKATSGRILYDRHCGFITTIDDSFCMVQVARYFLEFDRGVSCGKCVPCRIGSVQLRETLDRIIRGQGRPEDLELTERICNAMRDAAYCDFGKTSSAPVSLILKYFRSEFESHIDQRLCPAGVCPGLTGTREEE